MNAPECSIIIVNYNNPRLIEKCLETIDRFLGELRIEVVIVDNASRDHDLFTLQRRYGFVRLIFLHENMGFGFANNVGARNARSDTLLFLNSDIELTDSSLADVVKEYRAVAGRELWGMKLFYPDGRFQISYNNEITLANFLLHYTSLYSLARHVPQLMGHKYFYREFTERTDVDTVFGTAMLIKKEFFATLGGFSRKFFMYFEDNEFCERFRKHLQGKVRFIPESTLIHNVMGSSTRKKGLDTIFLTNKFIYARAKFGLLFTCLVMIPDVLLQFTVKTLRNALSSVWKRPSA